MDRDVLIIIGLTIALLGAVVAVGFLFGTGMLLAAKVLA